MRQISICDMSSAPVLRRRRGRNLPMTATRKARSGVLIAGGGFAGGYVARLLGRAGATIVSPENFMLYTPLLPEAASGTLEPRHVVVPLRQMCPHAELLLGHVRALDEERRVVSVETAGAGSFELSYEHLVLALGSRGAHAPGAGPRRARGGLQGSRGRDPLAEPRARPARDGGGPARRRGGCEPPDVRLRRRGLRRSRGARRALRSGRRRASLLPTARPSPTALGARRRERRRSWPRSRPGSATMRRAS